MTTLLTKKIMLIGAGGPLDADAEAYFAQMEVQPGGAEKRRLSKLFVDLKEGGHYQQIRDLWLPASHTEQAGMVNLKQGGSGALWRIGSGGWTAKEGLKASATQYYNAQIAHTDYGLIWAWVGDNASPEYAVYGLTLGYAATRVVFGSTVDASTKLGSHAYLIGDAMGPSGAYAGYIEAASPLAPAPWFDDTFVFVGRSASATVVAGYLNRGSGGVAVTPRTITGRSPRHPDPPVATPIGAYRQADGTMISDKRIIRATGFIPDCRAMLTSPAPITPFSTLLAFYLSDIGAI